MPLYTTLGGQEISTDDFSPRENNIVYNVNRFAEDPHLFTAHTLQTVGRTVHESLTAIAEDRDPLVRERPIAPAVQERLATIRDDVWQRLLEAAEIADADVQPDTAPSWGRGLYLNYITLPAEASSKAYAYHGELLEDKPETGRLAMDRIERGVKARGRTLAGCFVGCGPLDVAVMRLAVTENPPANDVFVNAFKRTHERMLKQKKNARRVDLSDIHAQNDADAAALIERYGTYVRRIVEGQASLGGYYGWRMAGGGR